MNRYAVVGVAAIVTLASAVGLLSYVNGADARAADGFDLVPVLVAQAGLAEGESYESFAAAGLISQSDTLVSSRPAAAVIDPADLAGTITTQSITEGQIIVASMFASPEELTGRAGPATFANSLEPGLVAVSFQAAAIAAVDDQIQPGDYVNLLLQVDSLAAGTNALPAGAADPTIGAIVPVFQNLRILAIGKVRAADPTAEVAPENPGTGTYTVQVAPIDAARLLHLTNKFTPFLLLVPPDNQPIEFPPIIDLNAFPNGRTPEESAAVLQELQRDGLSLDELVGSNADLLEFLAGATLKPVQAPPAEDPPAAEPVEEAA